MLRAIKWLVALVLTVGVAVGAVVLLTAYEELTATLPPLDRLLEYDPPVATRVYADDGSLIEEFFRERRYRVPIKEIPPLVRNAFLAAEDADFFAHSGVDFIGIVRALVANLRAGDVVQGASTITQQVVKALLLTPERSYERKLKEILLSLRLEQALSKEEILELYLNQIYFGDGNHGVGAAARNYFGKQVQELTPAEAALLAGLPAAPSRYSPNRDPEAAAKRQRYVLRRMLDEHFLSAGEYQAALREEVRVTGRRQQTVNAVRNYYTETVRLQLEEMFGAEAPYNQGYTVHTALQPKLQSIAEVAVRNGIERIDAALGYRGPLAHPADPESKPELAGATADPERLTDGVVTKVSRSSIEVTVGGSTATVDTSRLRWSSRAKTRSFRVGDVVELRCRENAKATVERRCVEGEDGKPKWFVGQTPEIEAALIAIDNEKGGVAAIVGGYDFMGSQFNRALQAMRQPGSAFKPFVYAAALDHGFTAASILQDSPVEYQDNDKLWAPRNYTRDYKGPMRLRTALEQSRNVVSVKLVDAVGVKTVVDYLARFHFGVKFGPNLSIALGTTEMTLRELTEAYTTFANGGVKVEAVIVKSIADKDGKPFFTDEPRRRETLSPETAALMTYILKGVVERGTATSIKELDRPVAGKTGTTNEQRDAWFIGYTPSLTVGVWVGFDDQTQTMGKMGTGGRVAAPIWLDFMQAALAGMPVRDFELPEDIACVNIDPNSGRRAAEWTSRPFLECFKAGTEPGGAGEQVVDADAGSAAAQRDPGMAVPLPGDVLSPTDTNQYRDDDEWGEGGGELPVEGDPRWPSARDPEQPPPARWPGDRNREAPPPSYRYPSESGQARREPDRYRAQPVPTPSGPEVRLYREPAPGSPPVLPPRILTPPRPRIPAEPPREGEPRIWGMNPTIVPPTPPANDPFRAPPSTAPAPRD